MNAMLPVPAGGMSVERAAEIVRAYGNDAMLLVGGSLLAAGDGLASARALSSTRSRARRHCGANGR